MATRNRTTELHPMFVHDDRDRRPIILRRRCDTLCTYLCTGFVDDVMFSHNGPYGASCAFLSGEWTV